MAPVYVIKILDNEAVVGTYTPHKLDYASGKRARKPLEPVPNYYPAVVDASLFRAVRDMRNGRSTRRATSPTKLQNVFAALSRCGRCGGSAVHINKGQRRGQGRYLVCGKAKTGAGCKYEAIPYPTAEQLFLYHAPDAVRNAPAGQDLDAQIDQARHNVLGIEGEIDDMVDELRHKHAPSVERRLRAKLEALGVSLEAAETELKTLVAEAEQTQGKIVQKRLADLKDALDAKKLDRVRINTALRLVVDHVVLGFGTHELVLHWRHGGASRVPFSTAAYGFDVAS